MTSIQVDLDKICAICLNDSVELNSIFDYDESKLSISDKIGSCFPEFNDLEEQDKPSQICNSCVQDLDAAYRFHKNCQTAVLLFRCTPISNELAVKVSNKQTVDELQSIKPEDEGLTQREDNKQTEYESEFCDLEQLKYDYDEEHLDDAGEMVYETQSLDSEDESNALDNELQNIEDTSEKTSASEEDKERKRLKVKNIKIKTFKTHKKNKERGHGPKICEICGNTYKYQHALNSHMRRHLNEKPFSCECCDKAFVSNVELRRHMRVHTGDKPYGCSYCERKFSDYGSRIKHERTHTGERPFVCQTCHKSFAYAHVLSVHLRTHTGEKKFQCTQCGKGFTKKSYMLAHMDQHRRLELLILKREEESHDAHPQPQSKTVHNTVLDHSEGSIGSPIYIVEEIDCDNNELKNFKDNEMEDQLQDVPCNESLIGMG